MAQDTTATVTVTVKSAYAQYCETKGVKPIALYVDKSLEALTKEAATQQGKKHTEWLRDTLIDAVRAQGFVYTPETKESLKDQVARQAQELEDLRAQLAASKAA